MEIYLITKEDRDKTFLFATKTRDEAEKIKNYLNNQMLENRGICYASIMTNVEAIPFGTYEDYLNKEKILKDIIFERTRELELLKNQLEAFLHDKQD